MEKTQLDAPLHFFVQHIREKLGEHLKEIILFGSRARGDNDPEADYDCLVIVDKNTSQFKEIINEVAGETLYQFDTLVGVLLMSEDRFKNDKYNPLLMNVRREGIAL